MNRPAPIGTGAAALAGCALAAPLLDKAGAATIAGFARQMAGAHYATVPHAAHMAMIDNPAAYLSILRPWLKEHDR